MDKQARKELLLFQELCMFGLSPIELLLIAVVVMVLFGKRLPEVGSGLGQAISNFRKSYRDGMAIDVTPKEDKAAQGQDKKV